MATSQGTSGIDSLTGGDGNDKIASGRGDDKLYGPAGDETLRGDGGNDILYGGASTDTLTGGADTGTLKGRIYNDVFFFERPFGNETVIDFDPGKDRVQIRSGGITSLADIRARMKRVGNDTLLTMDNGAAILFRNRAPSDFERGSFIIGEPVC